MEPFPIASVLASALLEFDTWLLTTGWQAKENECVNQFAHAYLAKKIVPREVLFDLAQIGIEVSVPQPPGWGQKKGVRKDLVIWPEPGMTTFDKDFSPAHAPMAIIEWKARQSRLSQNDLDWLIRFTRAYPHCFGAAVTVDFGAVDSRLHSAAVRVGVADRDWLPTIRKTMT